MLLEKHTVGNKLKYHNLLITADTRINTLADEFLTVDGSTGDVLAPRHAHRRRRPLDFGLR